MASKNMKNELEEQLAGFGLINPVLSRIKTSGNVAFNVRSGRKHYLLRLCGQVRRYRTLNQVLGEIELLEKLSRRGFPAPCPLKRKDGSSLICFEDLSGYMREWIEGDIVVGDATSEQAFEVGALLGRYHRIVRGYKAHNLRNGISFGLEYAKDYLSAERGMLEKYDKRLFESVRKNLASMRFSKELPCGMLHEDLGKRHVFWKKGKIIGVIDFDRSYYGPLVLDLGQAARGWCFVDKWKKWDESLFRSLVKGYESERKLSKAENSSLLPAVRFAITERALSFFSQAAYSKKPDKPAWRFARDSMEIQFPQI